MDESSKRKSVHRAQFKETAERVVPPVDIDQTKVLSDDELAQVQRDTQDRIAAEKMAAELGRAGLRERLKRTVAQFEKSTTRYLDPEKVKDYLDDKSK